MKPKWTENYNEMINKYVSNTTSNTTGNVGKIITSGSTSFNSGTWTYNGNSNNVGIENTYPAMDVNIKFPEYYTKQPTSIPSELFRIFQEVYKWDGKDEKEVIAKLDTGIQSYYYFRLLETENKEKQLNLIVSKPRNFTIVLECMISNYLLMCIKEDKTIIKAIINKRTQTQILFNLIITHFSEHLREITDRMEGTGKAIDTTYFTWLFPYILNPFIIVYGDVNEQQLGG